MHQIRPFLSYQSLLLAKPASHFVFAQPHFLCVRRVHAQQAPHRLEPQRAKRFFALRQSDPAQELPQTVGIAEQLDETLPMSEFDAHGFEILLAERVEIVAIHIALVSSFIPSQSAHCYRTTLRTPPIRPLPAAPARATTATSTPSPPFPRETPRNCPAEPARAPLPAWFPG